MADEMDELDALSNPELVQRAELENQRPKSLPPFLDIECDISPNQLQKYTASNEYGDYEAINLHLSGIKVNRCVEGEIFDDDEYDLEVKVPKKANSNAPLTLMVASSIKVDKAIASIRNWPGLKRAHLVEKVHFWTMRERAKDEFGEDLKEIDSKTGEEKQVWLERKVPSRYYALVGIGGKGGSAAKTPPPPKPEATEEVKAVAKFIIESAEDGITEAEFNKAAMKNETLKDCVDILRDGSLVTDLIASGVVIRDGDKLRVTA